MAIVPVVLVMTGLMAGRAPAEAPAIPPPDAAEIHAQAVVVDTHADTTQRIAYQGARFLDGIPEGHLDLARMRAGGIDAQFLAVFVSPRRTASDRFFAEAERQVQVIRGLADGSGGRLALARSAAEVRANAARGVPSILIGVEGAHVLAPGTQREQIARLERLAAAGVRYLTLTWTNTNAVGGSCGDGGDTRGLTAFGRRVIDEMHRLGVMVDLSHVSDATFWDAIRHARKPVLLSHSSARALANVPRNASDAMLRAIAENRGVACVNFNPAFLDADYARRQLPIWRRHDDLPIDERSRRVQADSAELAPVPLARLADHVMHAIEVAGIGSVCLGSDFDGVPTLPAGLEDAGKLPALTVELRRRGLSADDLAKLLGGNTLRVLEANETR